MEPAVIIDASGVSKTFLPLKDNAWPFLHHATQKGNSEALKSAEFHKAILIPAIVEYFSQMNVDWQGKWVGELVTMLKHMLMRTNIAYPA